MAKIVVIDPYMPKSLTIDYTYLHIPFRTLRIRALLG